MAAGTIYRPGQGNSGGSGSGGSSATGTDYPNNTRTVAAFGDSRIFLSQLNSGNNLFNKGFGIAHHIQAQSLGCVQMPYFHGPFVLNGGVAGDTTWQMLQRQPDFIRGLLRAGINLVFMLAGTNDRTGNQVPIEDTKQNIMQMVRNFQNAGIEVVLGNETPRGTGSSSYELTGQNLLDHVAISQWITKEMAKVCTIADTWNAWLDAASGNLFRPKANVVRDGIHPSKIGAMLLGKVIAAALMRHTRTLPDFLRSNTAWNPTTNPKGSLTPNPTMTGTTGSIAGNVGKVNGSVLATSWGSEGSNMTGLATLWSKEVDSDGDEWQVVNITGTAGATSPELTAYVDVPLTSLSDGDWVKASGLFKFTGTGLGNVGLALLMIPQYAQKLDGDDSDPSLPYLADGSLQSRETPCLFYKTALGVTMLRVRVLINITPNATVNATVKWCRTGAVKQDVAWPAEARIYQDIAPAYHTGLIAGRFYSSPHRTIADGAMAAGTAYAIPVFLPHRATINTVGFKVSTAASGVNAVMAIYSAERGKIQSQVWQASAAISCATTGDKEFTVNQTLEAGTYWLVLSTSGAVTIKFHTPASTDDRVGMFGQTASDVSDTTTHRVATMAQTYSVGGFPAAPGLVPTFVAQDNEPHLWFRVAA